MEPVPRLRSVRIQGFRPFKDFKAELGPLEVIVGANGSGKTSLFEFLRFLRDGMENEIPPGIVPGYVGQNVFHLPDSDRINWDIKVDLPGAARSAAYRGTLMGNLGAAYPSFESVVASRAEGGEGEPHEFLHAKDGRGSVREPVGHESSLGTIHRRLWLGQMHDRKRATLCGLREQIAGWRFYGSFAVNDTIRRADLVEQEPTLNEDASNISAVLHFLMTEHPRIFKELQTHLHTLCPGFEGLKVRARGAPGEVIAFWEEDGRELTMADLSDGLLRLVCWTVLCVQPSPPPLICIDEPELGLHPRTLPTLAGLFDLASDRTQIILATHSSYFLTQFNLSQIAVMRRLDGAAEFAKPGDSKALTEMLEDFGPERVDTMHRSGELESLP